MSERIASNGPLSSAIADHLNALPSLEARAALAQCCGAHRWVAGMMARRPFRSDETVMANADQLWFALGPDDWLEAFGHHPRIGEPSAPTQSLQARQSSEEEQAGMGLASNDLKAQMEQKNREYEEVFGHVFLICATGRTGEEMLAALVSRLNNDAETELRVAASEHAQITRIRLRRLVTTPAQNSTSAQT